MRVKTIYRVNKKNEGLWPKAFIVFEDDNREIKKHLMISGCARAALKPDQIKGEWYYQSLKAIREAYRDAAYYRGEDPSKIKSITEMPDGYMKIAEFIEELCE